MQGFLCFMGEVIWFTEIKTFMRWRELTLNAKEFDKFQFAELNSR